MPGKKKMSGAVLRKRELLFELQDGKCAACGGPMLFGVQNHPRTASVDHVVPTSRGGTGAWGNVLLKHAECNVAKGDSWPKDQERRYAQRIATQVKKRREQAFWDARKAANQKEQNQ